MHLSHSKSAMLVLSIPPDVDPLEAGFELHGLSGVASVTAYPERGQLLVRYDPDEVSADEVRSLVLPELGGQAALGAWLTAWPKVAEALPIAAGLL